MLSDNPSSSSPASLRSGRGTARFLGIVSAVGFLSAGAAAQAGQATWDFTTDPTTDPAGKLIIAGNNDTPWQSSGGNPGGFLAITYPIGSQFTGVVFPDIDGGKIVDSFAFECDLRVGNSTGDRAADGFAISFARANDPYLANLPDSAGVDANFAGNCCAETGTKTGIAISFDTWSGNTFPNDPADKSDIEGIIIRVDDVTVKKVPLPTRHGACNDATSLQTGPRNATYWADGGDPKDPISWSELCWAKFQCNVDNTGKVTVKFKGSTLLDNFQTAYFPSAGRLVMAGRTGGANEHTHVDNIKLTTTSFTDQSPPSVPSNLAGAPVNARRIKLTWNAATDDSGRAAYEIEKDGTLLPVLVSGTSYSISAKPDTSYSFKVRAVDPALNKSAFTSAVTVKTPVEVLTETKGVAKVEFYTDIGGTAVDALTSSDKYVAGTPDDVVAVAGIDTPNGWNENYGAKVSGFITPAEDGAYRFFIRSDDASQFWLSTNDKEANAVMIAEETGCCDGFKDPDDTQAPNFETSAPVNLKKGVKYAYYGLLKEGGGGDYMQVAWRKEGTTGSPVILAGDVISAMIDPNAGKPSILAHPSGASKTLTVSAIGSQPLRYQWTKRPLTSVTGSDIAGATSASYTVTDPTPALYSVTVSNDEGSSVSRAAMVLPDGTLFIEAEDFNFDGGKWVEDKPIGMSGVYAGGDYSARGGVDQVDFNNPGGNAGQPYRPDTGVAAGKANQHPDGLPRGSFDVKVNHVVGWNDGGDWQNYTRKFPEPAKDYNVYGRLSSGGNPINGVLDEVTAGATTPNQTLKKVGQFKPGRATAGWDNMEWFALTDDAGTAVTVNMGGVKTLRFTTQPDANLDLDYLMFVPAAVALPGDVTKPGDTIVSSHPNSRSPANEQVANAIDDKTSTKYLNFGDGTDTGAPLTGITGVTITPSVGGTIVVGLGLTSANDVPDRDPATYKLEGSNDGTTFTTISEGAVPKFTARFQRQTVSFANSAAYTVYRLTFPTVANNTAANSMQIAEIELLGTATGQPAAPKFTSIKVVGNNVVVEWTGSGTVQQAEAVTGPWTDVPGATSPATVPITGAGKFWRIKQ